jgi:ComF family protein
VHQLKYNNLRAITVELARLLFEYLKINPMDGDILIPVPLYHKRLKERGYNQSALLALELGKLASIPVDSAGMVRERYAVAQARTRNVEERRRNVAGVFQYHGEGVRGKNVIIIDDVSTSGATMNACAAALKAAGAVSVWGLALAREI